MPSCKWLALSLVFGFLCIVAVSCGASAPRAEPPRVPTLTADASSSYSGSAEQGYGGASAGATPAMTGQPSPVPAVALPPGAGISVSFADPEGTGLKKTVDGNALLVLARLGDKATAPVKVTFHLEGYPQPLAQCEVPQGSDSCSATVRADGWAWEDRKPVGTRTVVATTEGDPAKTGEATIAVAPKPIILVHGLNSDQTSWINWTRPGGYLEEVGVKGYAVDDGQFGTGKMNTGNPAKPLDHTKSITENAQVLAEYVEAVRRNTGAERVDLVAHSLGGLISRYYVQNLMPVVKTPGLPDVPVASQLYMAGTPNGGTVCGRIPAALGLFSPATTQITPEYLAQVFNPTVHDRRGVPFFAIAGDAVKAGAIAIRCTETPTDRYVSVNSVLHGVSVGPDTIDAIHSDLNNGRPTFERIFPSLARSPNEYPITVSDQTEPSLSPLELIQTTVVKGGTLKAGETTTVTIPIDQARNASFILFAPGSQVSMTIKTVAGKILTEETPKTNPNVTFERVFDQSLPLSLGYGVLNPKAGNWEVGLTARETPAGGGPFAVVATVDTDLTMTAEADPAVTGPGADVTLRAELRSAAAPKEVTVQAKVREEATGSITEVKLFDDGAHGDGAAGDGVFAAPWRPKKAGEYTVVIAATGKDSTGSAFERLSVIGVQAE
jgi:pimeloyl-ACP methyl ester carboxylesterase